MANFDKIHLRLKKLALFCIQNELNSYPCFGLISPYNNGCHKDMNYVTMKQSMVIFEPYFDAIYHLLKTNKEPDFFQLRTIGSYFEQQMFQITNQINTYKGLIFMFGIIYYALLFCVIHEKPLKQITHFISNFVTPFLKKDYLSKTLKKTHGMNLYLKYHIKGARQLAILGYKIVFFDAIQFLLKLNPIQNHITKNQLCLYLLIFFMGKIEDTTLIHKVGLKRFYQFQKQAQK